MLTCCVWTAQFNLELVGIDAILLVEGRELLYLKLLDAAATAALAPPALRPGPNDMTFTLALTVGDIGLRDMQVGL